MLANLHSYFHIDIDTLFMFTYKQSGNLRFMLQFYLPNGIEGPRKRGQPAYVWETELKKCSIRMFSGISSTIWTRKMIRYP